MREYVFVSFLITYIYIYLCIHFLACVQYETRYQFLQKKEDEDFLDNVYDEGDNDPYIYEYHSEDGYCSY